MCDPWRFEICRSHLSHMRVSIRDPWEKFRKGFLQFPSRVPHSFAILGFRHALT